MFRSYHRIALAAAILCAALPAGAAVDLAAPVPVGPQVKVGKLPNGLTYYIQRNGKPEHKLELRLVVKAGSVLEDDDQHGLAHMVEHLAFNGSTHFKKQELISYLQSIGVKLGADVNAYTGFDETVYMLPVPTAKAENVEQAFTVLEDWAHGVTLNADDLDKERGIVLEEARLHKGAGERVQKVLLPKLFNGSRYSVREPIGKEDVIRTATAETVRRFYRDWYRPDLMAVIVVGDIEPADAERLIRAHFAGLVNPAHERPRTYPQIAPLAKTEAIVFTDPEIPANSIMLRYPVRHAPDAGTYGSYRDKLVENLAGVMLNQRLAEVAQQPNPPFVGAGASDGPLTASYKAYSAVALLGAGGATPAITAITQEQQRLRQFGFSSAELARAGKMMLSQFERGYKERDTSDSSQYVAEYQRNFLAGESIPGIAAEYQLVQDFLPTIKLDDVNAFVRRAFPVDAGKLVLYVGGTTAGTAPTGDQLLAGIAAAEHAPVTNREEKSLATQLMARPAKPGAIVAETQDAPLGLTRLTLSNGVKVILKPTAFRKDQVMLGAQRFGGEMLFAEQDIPNARLAPSVAMTMGLGDFSPVDLQKMLAGSHAQVGMNFGANTDDISGMSGSSPQELETMLQMVWLRFNGVRRDPGLYQSFIGKITELVQHRAAVPEARFGDAVTAALYNGNPYAPHELTPQDLAQVNLDRSIALYRQRFSSAKGFTFIVAGDFDVATIKPLIASYLGTLPTPDLPLTTRDAGLRYARGIVKKDVLAGTEPKSIVSLTFSGAAPWSNADSLRLGALVDVLNLRVIDVVREKLGLIYSAQVSGSLVHYPYEHYAIAFTLPTGPDNVDKVAAAVFAEVERIKAEGPTQAELAKVKASWFQGNERWRKENAYWVQNLESSLLDGTDPARLLTLQDEHKAITAADVQKAAQRYLNKENYVEVVLKPETGAKVAGK